ncbi:O-antigen ligase family protein [Planctomycetota bacterium]
MTILIAVLGVILVMSLKPIHGLIVFIVCAIWYPYSVGTVTLATIDFSVGRILIIVLFIKILFDKNITQNFKWIWLDRLILILFGAEIVAGLFNAEPMKLLEYRGGDFFDMALPYFAVRLIITTKERYITLLKAIAWSAGILALFAFYESLTGHNLLAFGSRETSEIRMRFFYRARATFRVCIYYGIFSAMAAAMCMGLFKNIKKNKLVYKILVGLMFLGCFSSMSSGGLLAMVVGLAFIAFYKYRRQWKTAIIGIIIMCGVVEIVSNRHFYNVVDRFTFNSATAWYRTKLFEIAFFEGGMSGHWFTGFGCFTDPGWGERIDMRDHTDMVNHYLMKLSRYGLVGFIPFCMVILTAIRRLFKDFWLVSTDSDRWLIWCLAGGLFSVLSAFNSVSLFGQPMIMLFMMFGFCIAVPEIASKTSLLAPIER